MSAIFGEILPDYVSDLEGMLSVFGGFLVAGVLVSLIVWTIGIAVNGVYGWLNSWTSDSSERG